MDPQNPQNLGMDPQNPLGLGIEPPKPLSLGNLGHPPKTLSLGTPSPQNTAPRGAPECPLPPGGRFTHPRVPPQGLNLPPPPQIWDSLGVSPCPGVGARFGVSPEPPLPIPGVPEGVRDEGGRVQGGPQRHEGASQGPGGAPGRGVPQTHLVSPWGTRAERGGSAEPRARGWGDTGGSQEAPPNPPRPSLGVHQPPQPPPPPAQVTLQ